MNGLIIDGRVYERNTEDAGCRQCDLHTACMDFPFECRYCNIEFPNVDKREIYTYHYSPELTDKLNGKANPD